jgi:hypothetical protein
MDTTTDMKHFFRKKGAVSSTSIKAGLAAVLVGATAWIGPGTVAAQEVQPGLDGLAVPVFTEETLPSGFDSSFLGNDDEYMVGGGVATFDCNGDGMPEVFAAGGEGQSTFFMNRSTRGGALKLVATPVGLEVSAATGAYPLDIDGDGQLDLVVLRVGKVQVFRGLGQCRFEPANDRWNIHTEDHWYTAFSATWERGAQAGSGLPTLAFGSYFDRKRMNYPWGTCTPNLVFRAPSDGNRYGEPERLKPSHCALSMLFSDWSRSGHADLRISNDREYYKNGQEQLWQLPIGSPARLYKPEDGFKPIQIWGMGISSHDIDGDGYPEVFLTSMADNKLQKLEVPAGTAPARPAYTDVAFRRGATAHRPYVGGDLRPSTAWHAQFEDVNQDGWADLWIVKGNVTTMPDFAHKDPNNLMLLRADGQFVNAGEQAGVNSYRRGRGGMMVDLNADGLLDMIAVNRLDKSQVWRNTSSGLGGWLQLALVQPGGNHDAVGAWVEVDLGDRVIRREFTVGGGHASGHAGWRHLGLGTSTQPKLRVWWPRGEQGQWSEWTAFQPNGYYVMDFEKGLRSWSTP